MEKFDLECFFSKTTVLYEEKVRLDKEIMNRAIDQLIRSEENLLSWKEALEQAKEKNNG